VSVSYNQIKINNICTTKSHQHTKQWTLTKKNNISTISRRIVPILKKVLWIQYRKIWVKGIFATKNINNLRKRWSNLVIQVFMKSTCRSLGYLFPFNSQNDLPFTLPIMTQLVFFRKKVVYDKIILKICPNPLTLNLFPHQILITLLFLEILT
jgi:hypothetical protein